LAPYDLRGGFSCGLLEAISRLLFDYFAANRLERVNNSEKKAYQLILIFFPAAPLPQISYADYRPGKLASPTFGRVAKSARPVWTGLVKATQLIPLYKSRMQVVGSQKTRTATFYLPFSILNLSYSFG
jgi:hypothetical protein